MSKSSLGAGYVEKQKTAVPPAYARKVCDDV
jgi:hypothetical protein